MTAKRRKPRKDQVLQQNTIDIRVRYAECDAMAVAHHASYPIWLEMGRTELYRATGSTYLALEAEGLHLAVAALEIRYKAPVHYDDVITLETTLSQVGRAKLVHTYKLTREGILLATAETTLACVNSHRRLTPLPDSLTHQIP